MVTNRSESTAEKSRARGGGSELKARGTVMLRYVRSIRSPRRGGGGQARQHLLRLLSGGRGRVVIEDPLQANARLARPRIAGPARFGPHVRGRENAFGLRHLAGAGMRLRCRLGRRWLVRRGVIEGV